MKRSAGDVHRRKVNHHFVMHLLSVTLVRTVGQWGATFHSFGASPTISFPIESSISETVGDTHGGCVPLVPCGAKNRKAAGTALLFEGELHRRNECMPSTCIEEVKRCGTTLYAPLPSLHLHLYTFGVSCIELGCIARTGHVLPSLHCTCYTMTLRESSLRALVIYAEHDGRCT